MASRVVMPKLTDTMEEGLIIQWYKQEGDTVDSGDALAEIETDKSVMDLEAYSSGIMLKILVPAESKAAAGALIAVIGRQGEDIAEALKESPTQPKEETPKVKVLVPPPVPGKTVPASPLHATISVTPRAQHLALQEGLDLRTLRGSGPEGLIAERDVLSALEKEPLTASEFEWAELSGMRSTIARRMTQSKQSAPHFYVTVDINMNNALDLKEKLSKKGTKVTLTDILIRASALTLKDFPQINSAYVGQKIRRYQKIHIGLAVGLDDGILAPVVRDADSKSLSEIAGETLSLIQRAKSRKLAPEEYSGGTFSISNLGMFDVEHFIAIIQPGEGAVLAVGSVMEVPVVQKGSVAIAHRLKVTLSSDHRVIDGLQAAQFLKALKERIEEGRLE